MFLNAYLASSIITRILRRVQGRVAKLPSVMSVFGNIVVSLSWFGVNMLGVGLHSYGFMDKAFGTLVTFIASQLAVMALGMIPLKYWRGIQARGKLVCGENSSAPVTPEFPLHCG
jgi:uncharacterized membrane protein